MDEDAQQRITYLLQEIDANICAAHRSATQICGTVRRHHQILRQTHEASRVWRPLFDSFTQQPAARRATRTPSRYPRPFTPGSTRARLGANQQHNEQRQEREEQRIAEEDDEDDASFVNREQTFKTTTLQQHQPPASVGRNTSTEDDSLNFSINSDNLPRMSRTPYMSKSAVQSAAKTQESTSTFNSDDRERWSPRLRSPPRTGVILREQPQSDSRQISTPPSAISSVAYSTNSPGISRNLMKMGEFEYTPPRGKKSKSRGEEKEVDETIDSIATPYAPEFTTVRLSTVREGSTSNGLSPARTSESASNRKRKRSDAGERRRTPVYPKTHYPAKASSPFTSPSLRRKYSSRSSVASPSPRRTAEGQTRVAATPLQQMSESIDDDTPRTPELGLKSPLLRTQLKAMTPNTPLSNRLVGANLNVGSVSQETLLLDYDDSFNAGEPTPKFELSLLPAVFQRGVGAVQVSTLYSKFQGTDNDNPAISVDQLTEMLPEYGKEKIEILLDTLVSRRLLRPFVVEGTMFWQIPI
ncbi:hypothetical protein PR003_g48 [Phytophthora rubi]|uniref:Uncharacterized protein n=1 Tax=Phytophthora rubi TaxID=129364 RepID=A0A6A4G9X4_9STRA|nr:hypothetical protein PR001_g49 [Phytophthora rubi]KAE9360741.1 hypothetical protein PR003_g48 [Phytophthora rubi]